MPPLTFAQLAALGAIIVVASFSLNWFLARGVVNDFRARLERIERGINGDKGLLVRVAVLESERRSGPSDRRHHERPSLGDHL